MRSRRRFLVIGLAAAVAGATGTGIWLSRQPAHPPGSAVAVAHSHGETPVEAAHSHSHADAAGMPAAVVSDAPPPGPAPAGMVWIPGGTFWMGCAGCGMPDAEPVHLVTVDGFWMDEVPVTNAAFERFVRATEYVTVAERPLDPADYPGVPAASLVPGAVVFTPPAAVRSLANPGQWWQYVPGASWRQPEGPASSVRDRGDHPVVHVAWEDAAAYLQWAGKQLPTEAQFEFAARGGLDRQPFAWGSELRPDGKPAANIWQGSFPVSNTAEDGYRGTSPVTAFPPNGFGLRDMGGNVWQWCADWYRPDTYRGAPAEGRRNPTGPSASFDPAEPGVPKRVQRGGSFLCSEEYCVRYLVGSRGKGAVDTGSSNVGFRGVRPGS
jgi:formylglycine-generating enzyme